MIPRANYAAELLFEWWELACGYVIPSNIKSAAIKTYVWVHMCAFAASFVVV